MIDGEDHLAVLVCGADILVAPNREGVYNRLVDMLTSGFGAF